MLCVWTLHCVYVVSLGECFIYSVTCAIQVPLDMLTDKCVNCCVHCHIILHSSLVIDKHLNN